jgi:hypothetical protein
MRNLRHSEELQYMYVLRAVQLCGHISPSTQWFAWVTLACSVVRGVWPGAMVTCIPS